MGRCCIDVVGGAGGCGDPTLDGGSPVWKVPGGTRFSLSGAGFLWTFALVRRRSRSLGDVESCRFPSESSGGGELLNRRQRQPAVCLAMRPTGSGRH